MPNHFHAIIEITYPRRGGSRTALPEIIKNKPLGRIIGAFKTISTKQININNSTIGNQIWQRNYYEHIIRDEISYNNIYWYIMNNPQKWEKDKFWNG